MKANCLIDYKRIKKLILKNSGQSQTPTGLIKSFYHKYDVFF
jgi:hypothetical protein